MAAKYPSSENLQLCPVDRENPGECSSPSCYDLHICRDYLLTKKCVEFEANGKCSYSHSLFTRHNQRILEKKFRSAGKDKDIFDEVSQCIQASKSSSPEKDSSSRFKRSFSTEDDRKLELTNTTHSGQDRGQLSTKSKESVVFRATPSSTRTTKSVLSPPLAALTNSDHSRHSLSNPMNFSSTSKHFSTSLDLPNHPFDRHGDQNGHSSFSNDIDENNDTSSSAASSTRQGTSLRSSVHGLFSKVKDTFSSKPDPNNTIKSDSQLKYIFHRYTRDDELSFLHGPVRDDLVKRKQYQIFSSGYCRLTNVNEERDIEQRLKVALPITLKTDRVPLPNDELAFFICSSAAEKIFEQHQITYSIISQPYSGSLSIEVIPIGKDNPNTRSSSVPSRKILSSKLTDEQDTPHLSTPDGKFCIPQTNSTIDVIRDDITNAQVDLMVCVTTSATLLRSVLRKAGQSVESEYKRLSSSSSKSILLDGGSTAARHILFVPWELEVDSSDSFRVQKSLSDLVKRCLDHASKSHMKSIAFPSIGTGEIGLDPNNVSEVMINAASNCLQKYQMNVVFVIYSTSKGSDPNEQSYQAFRTYLDGFCRRGRPARAEISAARESTIPVERNRQIQRTAECKRISTVSPPSDMNFDHQQLLKSVERLIEERTFDLSLIQKPFLDEVEAIIDLCLQYHVLPRIDFPRGNLTLHGDSDSCSQCLANLRNSRQIYRYGIIKKTGEKQEESHLNVYVSMKIDEGHINDESHIRIEDANKTVYRIDVIKSKIQVNDDVRYFELYREQLNADSRISLPKSWSPVMTIRTFDMTRSPSSSNECLRLFQRTMLKEEWFIERVDVIENWPLYVHYTLEKSKDETIAFYGCSYSSVQSIIHYGLHSNSGLSSENSIQLTHDALSSHIRNARRSIDGKYYMFAVRLSKKLLNHDSVNLSNDNAHLALPTHLIVYRREIVV